MVLIDTSIWINHLRSGDAALFAMLEDGEVLTHPFIIGELACGQLAQRPEVLSLFNGLPRAPVARDPEVLALIEARGLMGRGIGYIDAHLLAATVLAESGQIWTHDRRLDDVAADLGLAYVA